MPKEFEHKLHEEQVSMQYPDVHEPEVSVDQPAANTSAFARFLETGSEEDGTVLDEGLRDVFERLDKWKRTNNFSGSLASADLVGQDENGDTISITITNFPGIIDSAPSTTIEVKGETAIKGRLHLTERESTIFYEPTDSEIERKPASSVFFESTNSPFFHAYYKKSIPTSDGEVTRRIAHPRQTANDKLFIDPIQNAKRFISFLEGATITRRGALDGSGFTDVKAAQAIKPRV